MQVLTHRWSVLAKSRRAGRAGLPLITGVPLWSIRGCYEIPNRVRHSWIILLMT